MNVHWPVWIKGFLIEKGYRFAVERLYTVKMARREEV